MSPVQVNVTVQTLEAARAFQLGLRSVVAGLEGTVAVLINSHERVW
jgi:hypothetical protein